MFPLNPEALHNPNLRHTEKYKVNFSHTENYKKSAVPFCQRLLNQDCIDQEQKERTRREQQQASAREQERASRQEEHEEGRARSINYFFLCHTVNVNQVHLCL